jgi:site-specific DNA-methyltransferase (adenine-specific)
VNQLAAIECVHLGPAVLYRADARDLLAGLSGVDVILTDPVWPHCPAGLIPGSDDPHGLWRDTMAVLPPLQRLVAVLRSDCDPRFLAPVPEALPFFNSIRLPYVMPHYLGRVMGGDELAHWFGSPIRTAPGRRVVPGRAPAAKPEHRPRNGHPCSRAQLHIDWLLDWCSDAGETVCDPFMGSGSTGVAAVRLGRPFIGIEIDPGYFDLACRRIENAMRQGDLFLARTTAPEPAGLS